VQVDSVVEGAGEEDAPDEAEGEGDVVETADADCEESV
jgi:hypothetical protein